MAWWWGIGLVLAGFTIGLPIRSRPPVAPSPIPPPSPLPTLVATAPFLPTDTILTIVDPDQLAVAQADTERVARLAAHIAAHGLRHPLEIVADARGRIVLKDGHHRLVVALRTGTVALPVTIKRSERIRGHSHPMRPVLEAALGHEQA